MTRVLIPVEILEGKTVSSGLMNLLKTVDVTVLGYHVLPEQTPPDQARLQFEDRATDALDDLIQEFETAEGTADHRLVFTHDREQSINRIANEVNADVLAVSGMTGNVEQLLVPLSGNVNVERILAFVDELIGDRDIGVTLFLSSDEGSDVDQFHAAAEQLREAGLTVDTEQRTGGSAFEALIDMVPGHDVIVMGEKAPSFRSLIFGDETDRVAEASVGPVLVVRATESSNDKTMEADTP